MKISEIEKMISGEIIPDKEKVDIETSLDKMEARRIGREKFLENFISRNPDRNKDDA